MRRARQVCRDGTSTVGQNINITDVGATRATDAVCGTVALDMEGSACIRCAWCARQLYGCGEVLWGMLLCALNTAIWLLRKGRSVAGALLGSCAQVVVFVALGACKRAAAAFAGLSDTAGTQTGDIARQGECPKLCGYGVNIGHIDNAPPTSSLPEEWYGPFGGLPIDGALPILPVNARHSLINSGCFDTLRDKAAALAYRPLLWCRPWAPTRASNVAKSVLLAMLSDTAPRPLALYGAPGVLRQYVSQVDEALYFARGEHCLREARLRQGAVVVFALRMSRPQPAWWRNSEAWRRAACDVSALCSAVVVLVLLSSATHDFLTDPIARAHYVPPQVATVVLVGNCDGSPLEWHMFSHGTTSHSDSGWPAQ